MKFEWIEEGDGRYRVQFFDMDEKKVFDIKITDYSDPYWQQSDLERKIRRECCYDVIFYAGHRKSYSDNPIYETEYGFQSSSCGVRHRATLTTRITKRNTVFRVNQNMT